MKKRLLLSSLAALMLCSGHSLAERCINDVKARAKPNQIQVTWQNQGVDAYRVLRSEQFAGIYTALGDTTSDYSTWLDKGIVEGKEYYYKVQILDNAGNVTCTSGATVGKAPSHINPNQPINHPPYILSQSMTFAEVSIPYSYFIYARDGDNEALTYRLLESPAGMTIDQTTGEVNWLPSAVGEYDVSIEVVDIHGAKAIQSFTIEVI